MEPQQESLTEPELHALLEGVDDEYKAVATCEKVIENLRRASREAHLPASRRCVEHSNNDQDRQRGHGRRRKRRGN